MNEKIVLSLPAKSDNKEILSELANSNIEIRERDPIGPQMNMAVELLHHCFVEISTGALNAIGEHLIDVLLPLLVLKIQKPKVMYFDGTPIQSEITKYLDRIAIRVSSPIYKDRLQREINTNFYFLIDSEWSAEEIRFATLYFKEEMRKFVAKESSEIDNLVSHHLISEVVVIQWDKEESKLIYTGPIPKHVLEKTKISNK
jgi:hypothetical protein